MKKLNFFSQILLIPSIFAICSNNLFGQNTNLTREEAKKMIITSLKINKIEFPIIRDRPIHMQVPKNCIYIDQNGNKAVDKSCSSDLEGINNWRTKGLIYYTESNEDADGPYLNTVLTKEGLKYLINTKIDTGPHSSKFNNYYIVKELIVNFGEITDIKMNEQLKTADVFFMLIGTPTPFTYSFSNLTEKHHFVFSLYDDGWKISKY